MSTAVFGFILALPALLFMAFILFIGVMILRRHARKTANHNPVTDVPVERSLRNVRREKL